MPNLQASRVLAIVAAFVFTGGALAILLDDAITNWHWRLDHMLAVLIVAGTIATGHLDVEALTRRRVFAVLGFAVLFVAGTALIVYNSVGRQSAQAEAQRLAIEDRNARRAAVREKKETAEAELDQLREKMAAECATGRGPRCEGLKASVAVYEAAVAGYKAEIDELGPPEPVAVKADKTATLLSLLFGLDQARAKAALILLEPFALALFFELGSAVSWGYVFGHRRSAAAQVAAVSAVSGPGNNRTTDSVLEDHEIEALRRAFYAGDGRPLTNDELARRMGVAKSEASKRVAKAIDLGLVTKRRTGRNVAIMLH